MSVKKFRWSQVYESSEEELIAFFQSRNIEGKRVHAEADSEQAEQHAEHTTTIWCAEGSLAVEAESSNTSLQPGDALRIEANAAFIVHPGIASCTYYLTA